MWCHRDSRDCRIQDRCSNQQCRNHALEDYTVDKQGIEIQLSVNHVGHFLLTNLLIPAFQARSRIVNITSSDYQISPFHFNDYTFPGGKTNDPCTGYGQANAQILFTYGRTNRLKQQRLVHSFTYQPGSNLDTTLGSHLIMDDYDEIPPITKTQYGQRILRSFVVGDEPRF